MGEFLCSCGSGKIASACCLSDYKQWPSKYKEQRYLQYLSEDELVARAIDILSNSMALRDDLKLWLHRIDKGGAYWMQVWSDVLTECDLRGHKFPGPLAHRIRAAIIPKFDWPGLSDAIKAFREKSIKEGTYWVKYGEYRFLKDTLEKGIFRIAPASSYTDPSLNLAQQDTELEVAIMASPSEVTLEAINEKTGKSEGRVMPIGNVELKFEAPSNYYVCCLALTFDPRMFGDFQADCALIVKKPKQFYERLLPAFARQIRGCNGNGQPVVYYDPLNPPKKPLSVHFSKHFKYSYQREYRFTWNPHSFFTQFNPVFIEMGSLEDICEIIRLPSAK